MARYAGMAGICRRLGRHKIAWDCCRDPSRDLWARLLRRRLTRCARRCGAQRCSICIWRFRIGPRKSGSKIVRGMIRQVGWMAGEFSQFPKYTRENIERVVIRGRLRKFRCRAPARQRRAVSHRPHERLGIVVFRACAVRLPAAFSGAANFQFARGRADQPLPLPFRQPADR